jgi:hypothetical protein
MGRNFVFMHQLIAVGGLFGTGLSAAADENHTSVVPSLASRYVVASESASVVSTLVVSASATLLIMIFGVLKCANNPAMTSTATALAGTRKRRKAAKMDRAGAEVFCGSDRWTSRAIFDQ